MTYEKQQFNHHLLIYNGTVVGTNLEYLHVIDKIEVTYSDCLELYNVLVFCNLSKSDASKRK